MANRTYGTKKIYMAVSNDEFRLPIAIGDTAEELAKQVGTTANNIHSIVSKYGENGRYIKVYIEREE